MCRTVDYRSRDDNYTFVPHEKECGRCDVMFTERSLKIQIRIQNTQLYFNAGKPVYGEIYINLEWRGARHLNLTKSHIKECYSSILLCTCHVCF